VGEAAQTGLLADLTGYEREYGVKAVKLVIKLIIGIGDDMVLLVRRYHEIGHGFPDAVKEQPAILALLRLNCGRGILLRKRAEQVHP
jgi:hypothetical protein